MPKMPMKMKSATKSMMKYGSVILLIAVVFLAWFFLARRENFVDIKKASKTTLQNDEFPKFVMPYDTKKGSYKVNDKKYFVKFAKMKIDKDTHHYIVVMDKETKNGYDIANATTGDYAAQVNPKNMIYLEKGALKSELGSKFVIGKTVGQFNGLKFDTKNGVTIRITDLYSPQDPPPPSSRPPSNPPSRLPPGVQPPRPPPYDSTTNRKN